MKFLKQQKGLTLIELLIVIAVLGILAAIILVAIDPLEQFARGRDASRKSTVGQLGHAVQASFTASGGTAYPVTAAWQTTLVNQGEIKNVVTGPTYAATSTVTCAPTVGGGINQGSFCYNSDLTANAVVWARLESKSDGGVGGVGGKCAAGESGYWVYSTSMGSACRVCAPNGAYTPAYTGLTCVN